MAGFLSAKNVSELYPCTAQCTLAPTYSSQSFGTGPTMAYLPLLIPSTLMACVQLYVYMVQKQGFLLIATHDLELVYALKNRYDTYYFDSQVHEKDIVFPYKIRRGIVGKTNAIDLMELLDFPEEITDQARREVGKR